MAEEIDIRRMRVLAVEHRVMHVDPMAKSVELKRFLHQSMAPVIGSAVLAEAAVYESDTKALWTDHKWQVGVLTPETTRSVRELLQIERNRGLDAAAALLGQRAQAAADEGSTYEANALWEGRDAVLTLRVNPVN